MRCFLKSFAWVHLVLILVSCRSYGSGIGLERGTDLCLSRAKFWLATPLLDFSLAFCSASFSMWDIAFSVTFPIIHSVHCLLADALLRAEGGLSHLEA